MTQKPLGSSFIRPAVEFVVSRMVPRVPRNFSREVAPLSNQGLVLWHPGFHPRFWIAFRQDTRPIDRQCDARWL